MRKFVFTSDYTEYPCAYPYVSSTCKYLYRVCCGGKERLRSAVVLWGGAVHAQGAADKDGCGPQAAGLGRVGGGWVAAFKGGARVDGDKVVLKLGLEGEESEEQACMRSGWRDDPACCLVVAVAEPTQKSS